MYYVHNVNNVNNQPALAVVVVGHRTSVQPPGSGRCHAMIRWPAAMMMIDLWEWPCIYMHSIYYSRLACSMRACMSPMSPLCCMCLCCMWVVMGVLRHLSPRSCVLPRRSYVVATTWICASCSPPYHGRHDDLIIPHSSTDRQNVYNTYTHCSRRLAHLLFLVFKSTLRHYSP